MSINELKSVLRRLLAILGLSAIFLTACSQTAPTVGTSRSFAEACDESNDGQRIAVEGFLRLPDSITVNVGPILRLYETDSFLGTPIGVSLDFGSEPNQIDTVPDSYVDSDLNVHLADEQVAGYGTKVRISGKMYYPLADVDFECGLSNPLVELAS